MYRKAFIFLAMCLMVLALGTVEVNAVTLPHPIIQLGCSAAFLSSGTIPPHTVTGSPTISVYYSAQNGSASGFASVPINPTTGAWQLTVKLTGKTPLPDGTRVYVEINETNAIPAVVYGNCHDTGAFSANIPGPALPTGFSLRRITCTTPVFDSAGGSPVPGAVITAGQTWFVNPTSVADRKSNWTEIFVGGFSNGFVPTRCISAVN